MFIASCYENVKLQCQTLIWGTLKLKVNKWPLIPPLQKCTMKLGDAPLSTWPYVLEAECLSGDTQSSFAKWGRAFIHSQYSRFAPLWIALSILCKGKWESSAIMCCVLLVLCKVRTNFWVYSQPVSSLLLAQCSQLLIVLIISYSIHKPWKLPLSLHLQLHHCALSSLSLFIHQI